MRKHCRVETIDLEILKNLYVFNLPNKKKFFLLGGLVGGRMDVLFSSAWNVGRVFSYSLFTSLSIIGRCPANMNIQA
jgi:hypothetical protein